MRDSADRLPTKVLFKSIPRAREERKGLLELLHSISPPEKAGQAFLPRSMAKPVIDGCTRLYKQIIREAWGGEIMEGGIIRVKINIRKLASLGMFGRNIGNKYLNILEERGFLRHRKTLHGSYVFLHWSRVLMSRRRRIAVLPARHFCRSVPLASGPGRNFTPPFLNPPSGVLKAVSHGSFRSVTDSRRVLGDPKFTAFSAMKGRKMYFNDAQLDLSMGPRPIEGVTQAKPQRVQPARAAAATYTDAATKPTHAQEHKAPYAVDESTLNNREQNFFSYLSQCFGEAWPRMNEQNGAWWLKLYRENADMAYEIAAETKSALREGRISTTPFRYAADLANRMRAWRCGEDHPLDCVEPSTEYAAAEARVRFSPKRDESTGCNRPQPTPGSWDRAKTIAEQSIRKWERQLARELNDIMDTADDDMREMLGRLLRLAKKNL